MEWDAQKATENLKNHAIAFEEAVTVFADPLENIFDDPDRAAQQKRIPLERNGREVA